MSQLLFQVLFWELKFYHGKNDEMPATDSYFLRSGLEVKKFEQFDKTEWVR